MFSSYKKVNTHQLHNYANRVRDNLEGFEFGQERAEEIGEIQFPCGIRLKESTSVFRRIVNSVTNVTQAPSTLYCGDMLSQKESVLCHTCNSELQHQIDYDVEVNDGIPLVNSREWKEANSTLLDETKNENAIVSFVKKHPKLAISASLLAVTGIMITSISAYSALSKQKPIDSSETFGENIGETLATNNGTTTTKNPLFPPTEHNETATISSNTTPVIEEKIYDERLDSDDVRNGISDIRLNVHNRLSETVSAKYSRCSTNLGCLKFDSQIIKPNASTTVIVPNLKTTHTMLKVIYSLESSGELKSSKSQAMITMPAAFAKVDLLSKGRLDKNYDDILNMTHTLLNFGDANRLDEGFEIANGRSYPSITTSDCELYIKNKWSGAGFQSHPKYTYLGNEIYLDQKYGYFGNSWKLPPYISNVKVNVMTSLATTPHEYSAWSSEKLNALLEGNNDKAICLETTYDSDWLSDMHKGKCRPS